ncbi:ribosomal protein bL36 [Rickettsia endosymbiont of Cardiosporidium cionae]|nr:ribosomal protein bL36 [Rickettsia endosymbiont of Cardiosporidium cionae]
MKIISSLKSARKRSRNCKLIKRGFKIFVIDKKNKRFKARQG